MSEEQILQAMDTQNQLLSKLVTLQYEVREAQKKKEGKHEIVLGNALTISSDDFKTVDVTNPGFNRCRIFLDTIFTTGHSGGLSVKLTYKNSIVGDIMNILSSNGPTGSASLPVDISELPAFGLEIRNNDKSKSTKVWGIKIILYNNRS